MEKRLVKKAILKSGVYPVVFWLLIVTSFIMGFVFYQSVKSNKKYDFSMSDTINGILTPNSSIFLNWWLFIASLLVAAVVFSLSYFSEFSKVKTKLARMLPIHESISQALRKTANRNVIQPTPTEINVKKPKEVLNALDTVQKDLNITWWDGGDSIRSESEKEYLKELKNQPDSSFDYFGITEFDNEKIHSRKETINDENILSIGVRIGRRYEATMFDFMAIIESIENYENSIERKKAESYNKKNKSMIAKGKLTEANPRKIFFTADPNDIFGSQIRTSRSIRQTSARIFNEKVNIIGALNSVAFVGTDDTKIGTYVPNILFSDEFSEGDSARFTKVIITNSDLDFESNESLIDIRALLDFFVSSYPLPEGLLWDVTEKRGVITAEVVEHQKMNPREQRVRKFTENALTAVSRVAPIKGKIRDIELNEITELGQLKAFTVIFSFDNGVPDIEDLSDMNKFTSGVLKILKAKIPGDWDAQFTESNSELIVKNFSE